MHRASLVIERYYIRTNMSTTPERLAEARERVCDTLGTESLSSQQSEKEELSLLLFSLTDGSEAASRLTFFLGVLYNVLDATHCQGSDGFHFEIHHLEFVVESLLDRLPTRR